MAPSHGLPVLGWRRPDLRPALTAWIGTAGLLAVMGVLAPQALSWGYVSNVLRQASPLGIAALGQMLTLLVAGLDMSVGSVVTLTNILLTELLAGHMENLWAALGAVYASGVVIGLFNGLTVAYLRVPPIVVTLATGALAQGTYLILTGGVPRGFIPGEFRVLAEGWVGPLPGAWLLWMAVGASLWVLLYRTPYGKQLYATGANRMTAFASGVRVRPVLVSAYVLSSVLAVTAGVLVSSYVGVASLTVGDDFTLNSLAAAVLGGVLFTGGVGGVVGVGAGALFLFLLQSILVNLQVGQGGRWVAQGALLVLMIVLSAYQQRRRGG